MAQSFDNLNLHSGTLKHLAIRFHPIGTSSLNVGSNLRVHLDMNGRIVSLQGEIRRISEKFGHLILGLEYDPNEIALFNFDTSSTPQKIQE